MATYSKLGYGNAANLDTAITNGKIDGKDIVITKDTSEFYYIRDDKTKQAIRPRPAMYNSVSAAEIDLAKNSDTFAGQTVMIRAEDGKYAPYIVQDKAEGGYQVDALGGTGGGFVWQEF